MKRYYITCGGLFDSVCFAKCPLDAAVEAAKFMPCPEDYREFIFQVFELDDKLEVVYNYCVAWGTVMRSGGWKTVAGDGV